MSPANHEVTVIEVDIITTNTVDSKLAALSGNIILSLRQFGNVQNIIDSLYEIYEQTVNAPLHKVLQWNIVYVADG